MRYLLCLARCLIVSLVATPLLAQQEGQFTQFMYNKQYFNPAYSGVRGVPTMTAHYRKQWMGFDGAPVHIQLAFNGPVANNRIGLGILLLRQTAGIIQNNEMALSYSYSLANTEKMTFKIGLQAAVNQSNIDFADKDLIVLEPNDPSIGEEATSKTSGNVGIGLYIGHTNAYLGLSAPHILESTMGINDVGTLTAVRKRHFYLMAGAAIPLGEKIKFVPALLVKHTKGVPPSVDAHVGIKFFDAITVGTSYRNGGLEGADSIDFLLHFLIKKRLGLGLAYDNSLSPIKDFTKGSVELALQFDLRERTGMAGQGGRGDDISNPRFF